MDRNPDRQMDRWIDRVTSWSSDRAKNVEIFRKSTKNLQGVPEKTLVCVKRLLEALKNELKIKVG